MGILFSLLPSFFFIPPISSLRILSALSARLLPISQTHHGQCRSWSRSDRRLPHPLQPAASGGGSAICFLFRLSLSSNALYERHHKGFASESRPSRGDPSLAPGQSATLAEIPISPTPVLCPYPVVTFASCQWRCQWRTPASLLAMLCCPFPLHLT